MGPTLGANAVAWSERRRSNDSETGKQFTTFIRAQAERCYLSGARNRTDKLSTRQDTGQTNRSTHNNGVTYIETIQ